MAALLFFNFLLMILRICFVYYMISTKHCTETCVTVREKNKSCWIQQPKRGKVATALRFCIPRSNH